MTMRPRSYLKNGVMRDVSPDFAALAEMRFHALTGERKGEATRFTTRRMGAMDAHVVRKASYLGVRVEIRGLGGSVARAPCSSCR